MSHAQNGIVTYVDVMMRALRAAGHECAVITRNLMERGDNDAVYVADRPDDNIVRSMTARLSRGFPGPWRNDSRRNAEAIARALAQASKTGPVDVFEIEESFGYPFFIGRRASTPVAIRLHGPHFLLRQKPYSPRERERIEAEGKAITAARAVSCPSRGVLDEVRAFYGAAGAVNAVIPNPVDIPAEEHCWRLENCDRDMLLFVGRFDRVKGADIMLDAFARIAPRRKTLRLVMTGADMGVPDADGAAVKFDAFARARLPDDIRARVLFLERVEPGRLADLRRQAFACVSTSRFEVFSYAVSEALAMGCPVISTSTPGPRELFADGDGILLAGVENAEEIVAHIDALLERPERARALGQAGRRAVEAQLRPEIIVARALEFYRRVGDGN